jgi:hypothetical protein
VKVGSAIDVMYNAGFEAGASQFNGGGFMPSPGVQAGSGSAQKRSYDQTSQAVRRVTIKQLHQALEENNTESIIVDGKELVNVSWIHRSFDSFGSVKRNAQNELNYKFLRQAILFKKR